MPVADRHRQEVAGAVYGDRVSLSRRECDACPVRRPDAVDVARRIKSQAGQTTTNEVHQPDIAVALLKTQLTKDEFIHIPTLATLIKNIPLSITAAASIDEAISTVGGIPFDEVDEHFQLMKLPNHYVIGEMLDWDAPTGGYLLQACFSMGAYLAKWLNNGCEI